MPQPTTPHKARKQGSGKRAAGSRDNSNVDRKSRGSGSVEEFLPEGNLPGKVDSGPEPDVFGREIPPQK